MFAQLPQVTRLRFRFVQWLWDVVGIRQAGLDLGAQEILQLLG